MRLGQKKAILATLTTRNLFLKTAIGSCIAMKTVNKVTLMGAVGRDPEIRMSQTNMSIARFSLATSKKQKDKSEVTQWHNLVAFGKTAELVQQYVGKGSRLYIEGEIQYQQYEKDGVQRTATKIIVNDMSFLSDKNNQCANQDTQKAAHNDKKSSQELADYFPEDDEVPF